MLLIECTTILIVDDDKADFAAVSFAIKNSSSHVTYKVRCWEFFGEHWWRLEQTKRGNSTKAMSLHMWLGVNMYISIFFGMTMSEWV